MNEMEEQKKANLETSCCNMQNKLVKIENIVTVAMANQPERVGENWQHLSKALADIRQLCKDPFEYVTPKAVVDAIKAGELPFGGSRAVEPEIEPKKRGLVGERYNDTSAMAWSMTDGLDILVSARKVKDGVWSIEGRSHGRLFISATVFGGKWRAVRYLEFIRNGMVSRAMRRKNNPNRRKAEGSPENSTSSTLLHG